MIRAVLSLSLLACGLLATAAQPPPEQPPPSQPLNAKAPSAQAPSAQAPSAQLPSATPPPTQPAVGTQPVAPQAPVTPQRLHDLLNLIEGPNSPQVRRTGARELLLLGGAEAPVRVIAILNGANNPARIALAAALSDLPQLITADYLEPLISMLSDADVGVRQAAGPALAAMPSEIVTPRLQRFVRDAESSAVARLAGIAALGQMTSRAAIEVLVELLGDPAPGISSAALEALEQATATEFNGDIETALAWWQSQRELTREAWQSRQIARLVRKDREATRLLLSTEARLVKLLRESYQRAGESERVTLLLSYLADASSAVRLLGLELTISAVEEGRPPPAEAATQVRALLSAAEPAVRVAAVRTLVALRDATDADRLVELLPTVRQREVRLAMVNALGYLGEQSHLPALRALLQSADRSLAHEAVIALGRLAERGVLPDAERAALALELVALYEGAARNDGGLRERICWTIGFLGRSEGAPILLAALAATETSAVRVAAARSLARLAWPGNLEPLIGLVSDTDLSVRKAAVEALAGIGGGDRQLAALWTRLAAPQEADETVRHAAWRGVVRILTTRTPDEIEAWIDRLPDNGAEHLVRSIELRRLLESQLVSIPDQRARLATVRLRLAESYTAAGRPGEAVGLLSAALPELAAAAAPAAQRAAAELVRLSLATGQYDERVPAALANAHITLTAELLWPLLRVDLEARLTPAASGGLRADLERLLQQRPCEWPEEIERELLTLLSRATDLQHEASASNADSSTRPAE